MATASGVIYGTTTNDYISSCIYWYAETDIDTNASKVQAILQYRRTNPGYTTKGTGTFLVTINGKNTTATKYLTIGNEWVTALEATVYVAHNPDGAKTITISGAGTIPDTTLGSTTVSGKVELPTIPRASILNSLSCNTLFFDGKMTYRFTPQSASFYNRCNISLNLNGEFIQVKSILIGKKAASQQTATVTLSESELATIYNKLPSATKGTLRFTLRTYSDSEYSDQIGDPSYKEIELRIQSTTATQPTATMTLSPVSSLESPFSSLYINGRTKVDANFTNGAGKYGATIVSYSMSVDGKSYGSPYTSGYLSKTGDLTVTGTVTDSRGFSRNYTKTITVIPYSKPSILPASTDSAIVCARCDKNGNLSESGTYLKIKARRSYSKVESNGEQKNFCAIRFRYREESATGFSAWRIILAGTTLASDTADTNPIADVVTSTETAYVVQVGVIDDIGESSAVQFTIPTDFVTMDVPEDHKGKRIGFFRYAQETSEDGMYVGLPIFGGSVDSLKLGTSLTATETAPIDLNDIKTPGCYYSPGGDYSKYIKNSPYTTGGFGLEVRELQSKNYLRQTLYFGRTTLVRHWNTTEWSDWLRYMATPEVESSTVDFVTDIGVWNIDDNDTDKGYWRYRKWKSGAVDMNGFIKVSPETEGTLGTAGVYYSKTINIDLPFEVSNFQFVGSGSAYHIFVGNTNSVDENSKQIRLRLYRFADFSGLADYDVYIRIIASGKLK